MHELKSSPKRYQNPEVFEQLAIEYAVGTMQGRARKRFEVLMDTHFYLRATVDAYENKFANLVELLPDAKPSNKVWDNIEAHIKESTPQEEKTPWWQTNFFKQGFGMTAMALVVAAVLIYNPMTGHDPIATAYSSYNAVMESDEGAMAYTKIDRSDLKLSIDIMKPVYVSDDLELTLWCHPKDGGKPMKMGTISKTGKTELTISEEEFENLKNVGKLAVSLEKKGLATIKEPSTRIILTGQLNHSE